MDKRKNNGGHSTNGGRKSKAEEQSLIEKLTPLEPIAFKALTDALNDGKDWAVKLFFQYNFGMPKQTIDSKVEVSNFDLKESIKFKVSESDLKMDGGSSIKDFDNLK